MAARARAAVTHEAGRRRLRRRRRTTTRPDPLRARLDAAAAAGRAPGSPRARRRSTFGAWVANARASARASRASPRARLAGPAAGVGAARAPGAWDGWARAVAGYARLRTAVAARVGPRGGGAPAAFEYLVGERRRAPANGARAASLASANGSWRGRFEGWVTNAGAATHRFSLASARAAGVARRLAARARDADPRRGARRPRRARTAGRWRRTCWRACCIRRRAPAPPGTLGLAAARGAEGGEANLEAAPDAQARRARSGFCGGTGTPSTRTSRWRWRTSWARARPRRRRRRRWARMRRGAGGWGCPRRCEACAPRGGGTASPCPRSDSTRARSDEDMSRASEAVAVQSAADAMLFSAPADPDGGFDVKEAGARSRGMHGEERARPAIAVPPRGERRGRGGRGLSRARARRKTLDSRSALAAATNRTST